MSGEQDLGTGDGLGGGVASSSGQADIQKRVESMMNRMGVPGKVKASRFAAQMAQIDTLFGAKSKDAKESVKDSLTYLAIVNGSGPNVQWEEISCEPEGCKVVMMNEVVDNIITRKYHRRFMANFSQRAINMYNASPALQNQLVERAIRNGTPITEAMSAIDFLDSSSGMAPGILALRVQSKYSAVARANNSGKNSLEKSAGVASGAMHTFNSDGDADSLGGM